MRKGAQKGGMGAQRKRFEGDFLLRLNAERGVQETMFESGGDTNPQRQSNALRLYFLHLQAKILRVHSR